MEEDEPQEANGHDCDDGSSDSSTSLVSMPDFGNEEEEKQEKKKKVKRQTVSLQEAASEKKGRTFRCD